MSAFGARPAGLRLDRIRASAQFYDGLFRNTSRRGAGLARGSGLQVLSDLVRSAARRTPPAPLPARNPRAAWRAAPETGLRATWLGHSTALVEIDGARLLTDPVWSSRVSPFRWAGPRRFQPVPVALRDLPPLDAVLISHDHYDHLDHQTILSLRPILRDTAAPFVTSLGVGAHLEAWGVPAERIVELDWWESFDVPGRGVRVTAAPSQHFSGRGAGTRDRTLWSSFAVRGDRHAAFFSGDTGLTAEYEQIARRLGPFDVVMLEVGAFHEAWGHVHLGPENALEALELLGGGKLLPVHWGTFSLGLHPWDEPAETLLDLAPRRGAELVMPMLGQPVEPARAEPPVPWWRDRWWRESAGRGAGWRELAPASRERVTQRP